MLVIELVLLSSKMPIANSGVRTLSTESSSVLLDTEPDSTASLSLSLKYTPAGISWSRPSLIEVLCVAPQSLITKKRLPAPRRCCFGGEGGDGGGGSWCARFCLSCLCVCVCLWYLCVCLWYVRLRKCQPLTLRSTASVWLFSHEYTLLILLYEHMKLPTPASTAPFGQYNTNHQHQ